jgi:hypothetical protein
MLFLHTCIGVEGRTFSIDEWTLKLGFGRRRHYFLLDIGSVNVL